MKIAQFYPSCFLQLPLFISRVKAGFPSPADDYLELKLDLNEHLIKHPSATFFVKVEGDSMINAGILPGDTLIIDRSIEPMNNKIVLAIVNGEFTIKRFKKEGGNTSLWPENPRYRPIYAKEGQNFQVWGVVIHAIHSFPA